MSLLRHMSNIHHRMRGNGCKYFLYIVEPNCAHVDSYFSSMHIGSIIHYSYCLAGMIVHITPCCFSFCIWTAPSKKEQLLQLDAYLVYIYTNMATMPYIFGV